VIPKEVVQFVTQNPTAFVGTVESGKPHVRAMLLFSADSDQLIFVAGRGKSMCREIERNPNIEACFYSSQETRTLRIEAEAEFFSDPDISRQIINRWPVTEMYAANQDDPGFATFRIRRGTASFWSISSPGGGGEERIEF